MTFYCPEFDRTIHVNRKNIIRRLSLKVCRVTGQISINASVYIPNSDIINFFNKNRSWVSKQLNKCVVPLLVEKGLRLPIEGNYYEIVLKNNISAVGLYNSSKICLPKNIMNIGQAVQKFLIKYCKSIMIPIILKKSIDPKLINSLYKIKALDLNKFTDPSFSLACFFLSKRSS